MRSIANTSPGKRHGVKAMFVVERNVRINFRNYKNPDREISYVGGQRMQNHGIQVCSTRKWDLKFDVVFKSEYKLDPLSFEIHDSFGVDVKQSACNSGSNLQPLKWYGFLYWEWVMVVYVSSSMVWLHLFLHPEICPSIHQVIQLPLS